jgi:DNA primase
VGVLKFLVPGVQRISDRLERMAVANDLAGYIGVDRGVVLDSFRKAVADRQEKPLEPPAVELRHDERMLLNAILSDPDIAREILPALESLETIARFSSRRIFQAIFSLDAGGGRLIFEELNARLEEPDQRLLAEAVLREDMQSSREEVLAAVESMRRSEEQHRRVGLKSRIREAERAGNREEALKLTGELQLLERTSRGRA